MELTEKKYYIYYTPVCFLPSLIPFTTEFQYQLVELNSDNFETCLGKSDDFIALYLIDEIFFQTHQLKLEEIFRYRDTPFQGILYFYKDEFRPSNFRYSDNILQSFPLPLTEKKGGVFLQVLKKSMQIMEGEFDALVTQRQLLQRSHQLNEVAKIGIALSTERNHDKLLALILNKAKDLSTSDSGSLYLVEKSPKSKSKRLRFKLSSMNLNATEFTIPIDQNSIAGYVALTGKIVNLADAYYPPQDSGFKINKSFDQETGYRTKSMIVVPMKNQKDEVIGVLQLINRKPSRSLRLENPEQIERVVIPFDDISIELVTSLAGQAAVSIENNILYQDIHNLFEGFVTAAVTAIESRDPTTSGHSSRVATLTVGLAETLDKIKSGPYAKTSFTSDQIREIRYASLLHDFGKVGVREKVLVKAKKLYPYDLQTIDERFAFIKRTLQYEFSQKKLDYLLAKNRQATLEELGFFDRELEAAMKEMDDYLKLILEANEPTVLESGSFEKILSIAKMTYLDINQTPRHLLLDPETTVLSIRKGSLSQDERLEIESHVTHTFKFLSQIPWTSELRQIPEIAYAHHEKLDGSGYPNGLQSQQIPTQSKIMTITDIFDALTSRDRPYKRAVPFDKALDILSYEVKDQLVDKDLFQIFVDAKIFDLVRS